MKKIKLTEKEKQIENAVMRGQYRPVIGQRFKEIAAAIAARKKDITMTIRLNGHDVENIKEKAKKLGVRYQTFIAEILHEVAVH